jgi:hypothetical protein
MRTIEIGENKLRFPQCKPVQVDRDLAVRLVQLCERLLSLLESERLAAVPAFPVLSPSGRGKSLFSMFFLASYEPARCQVCSRVGSLSNDARGAPSEGSVRYLDPVAGPWPAGTVVKDTEPLCTRCSAVVREIATADPTWSAADARQEHCPLPDRLNHGFLAPGRRTVQLWPDFLSCISAGQPATPGCLRPGSLRRIGACRGALPTRPVFVPGRPRIVSRWASLPGGRFGRGFDLADVVDPPAPRMLVVRGISDFLGCSRRRPRASTEPADRRYGRARPPRATKMAVRMHARRGGCEPRSRALHDRRSRAMPRISVRTEWLFLRLLLHGAEPPRSIAGTSFIGERAALAAGHDCVLAQPAQTPSGPARGRGMNELPHHGVVARSFIQVAHAGADGRCRPWRETPGAGRRTGVLPERGKPWAQPDSHHRMYSRSTAAQNHCRQPAARCNLPESLAGVLSTVTPPRPAGGLRRTTSGPRRDHSSGASRPARAGCSRRPPAHVGPSFLRTLFRTSLRIVTRGASVSAVVQRGVPAASLSSMAYCNL